MPVHTRSRAARSTAIGPRIRRRLHTPFGALGRGLICTAAALALGVGNAPPAGAVPAPPDNPSDQQIQDSRQQAAASAAEVGRLAGLVSKTQGDIERLKSDMEFKAELANKAAVDLQVAQSDAVAALAGAQQARADADAAGQAIVDARAKAAAFAAASFRQGSVLGSMSAFMGAGSATDVLQRQELLGQMSGSQLNVIGNLESTRTHKANLDSAARASLDGANAAQARADEAKVAADASQRQASESFQNGQDQLTALQAQHDQQQADYGAALAAVSGLENQREQYNQWLAQKAAEEEAARKAAEEAARRAAEQAAAEAAQQAARAAQEAQNAASNRTSSLSTAGSAADSGSGGQRAVDAAMAYLGTTYAWGGGDSAGPTMGVRDAGVADQHGDYKKVGFDCSGLTLYAWAQVGVNLPHYSGYQFSGEPKVARSDLRPGDLVFYAYNTSDPGTIHHVAMWIGGDRIIEARGSGSQVKIAPMDWAGYIGAARPGR